MSYRALNDHTGLFTCDGCGFTAPTGGATGLSWMPEEFTDVSFTNHPALGPGYVFGYFCRTCIALPVDVLAVACKQAELSEVTS
jgi:hypothetical protein